MGMYVVRLNSDTNNPLNKILFFRTNDEHIGDVLLSTNVVYGRNGLRTISMNCVEVMTFKLHRTITENSVEVIGRSTCTRQLLKIVYKL
jgi:hypothetical protein